MNKSSIRLMSIMAVAMLSMLAAVDAQATALTQAVNTPRRAGQGLGIVVTSNQVVYGGAIACIDTATGKIVPATDSTGLMVVGMIEATCDNGGINTANYLATRRASVARGVFHWSNGGSFTAANVGSMCYVQDDQTVTTAAAATYDIPAGIIMEVDDTGVWVDVSSLSRVLSGSLNSLAVTGAGSFGTTLAAGGATTLGSTLMVTGTVTAAGAAHITGATALGSTLTVTGAVVTVAGATIGGALDVTGALAVNGSLTCTNGTVILTNIPTSTNGLTTGMLWSNSGVLTIKP